MAAAKATSLSKEQQVVVDYLTHNYVNGSPKNLLLFHETGTGKTRCAVACVTQLMEKGLGSVMLICPLAVKKQWYATFKDFNTELEDGYIRTIHSFYNYWLKLPDSEKNELATNRILVVDETHLIRNTETLEPAAAEEAEEGEVEFKSKFMQSLIDFSDRVRARGGIILALTATPILHKPSDFSHYFRLLLNKPYDARKFAYDDAQFDARFRNMEHFKSLACGLVSYYKNVKSVETGWAPVERITVAVKLTDAQTKQYFTDRTKRWALRKVKRQRPQDTFRVYSRSWFLINSDKMNVVIDFILNNPARKHVVYSNFVKDGVNLFKTRFNQEMVRRGVRELKLFDPCIISAQTTADTRNTCVQAFNEGRNHVILLASAGREGIDFKGATYMHILDLPWSNADVLQIEGRVSRRNAHAPGETVIIRTYVCTSDTVRTSDDALTKSILKKEEAIAPYLQALKQVSIESKTPCPQLTEDVLRESYYPPGADTYLYKVEIAKRKTQEALSDDDDNDDVIPAKYADFRVPTDLDVEFRTNLGPGLEKIPKGTTIKEYRNKYTENLENAEKALSKDKFIIEKEVLDAKLDAVLSAMYAVAKTAQPLKRGRNEEDDELERAIQMSKVKKQARAAKPTPEEIQLQKAIQMSMEPLAEMSLQKAKPTLEDKQLQRAIKLSLEK